MESISEILRRWNKSTSERVKLQHVYLFIMVVMTVVAGVVALINAKLGHQLILISGIALVAFLANAVVWALTRVYVVAHLIERKRSAGKR